MTIEGFDPLIRFVMELDINGFILSVHHFESVWSIAIHKAVTLWMKLSLEMSMIKQYNWRSQLLFQPEFRSNYFIVFYAFHCCFRKNSSNKFVKYLGKAIYFADRILLWFCLFCMSFFKKESFDNFIDTSYVIVYLTKKNYSKACRWQRFYDLIFFKFR